MMAQTDAPSPRFLIARFSALGDIVLMQPVITALRNTYGPAAQVDLICLRRCEEAAQVLGGLDHIHLVEKGTGECIEAIQERRYDYLLDLHQSVRSRSLAGQMDSLVLKVNKANVARWMHIRGWRKEPVPSFVERCFDVVAPFGIVPPAESLWGPDAWGSLTAEELSPHLEERVPKDHVALCLGSSQPGKHLSEDVVHAVLQWTQRQGHALVLLGGSAERPRAKELAEGWPHAVDLTGACTLLETVGVFQRAAALVTGDTVTMHLGAATGRPMASIWGCTRPALGLRAWRPHPKSQDILPERASEDPRPCSKHGATCRHANGQDPKSAGRCSQKVDPSHVLNWLEKVLS